MTESVTDSRHTKSNELPLLWSKRERYYYDRKRY